MYGNKVIEVREVNINKGIVAMSLCQGYDFILAIKYDITDEDMFNTIISRSLNIFEGGDELIQNK